MIVSFAEVGTWFKQPTQTWRNMEKAEASKPVTNTQPHYVWFATTTLIKAVVGLRPSDSLLGNWHTTRLSRF